MQVVLANIWLHSPKVHVAGSLCPFISFPKVAYTTGGG